MTLKEIFPDKDKFGMIINLGREDKYHSTKEGKEEASCWIKFFEISKKDIHTFLNAEIWSAQNFNRAKRYLFEKSIEYRFLDIKEVNKIKNNIEVIFRDYENIHS